MHNYYRQAKDAYKVVMRRLSICSDASDVINSVHSESDIANNSSLSELKIGGVLSRSSDQIIEVGCYVTAL